MDPQIIPPSSYLLRMADGTVKQINPFTGTEVWTVPRRGTRPRNNVGQHGAPIDPARAGAYCAFCSGRMLETPPEKARLVAASEGSFQLLRDLDAESLFATEPEFRRVPNLFEIVSYDFWAKNFGYTMPDEYRSMIAEIVRLVDGPLEISAGSELLDELKGRTH